MGSISYDFSEGNFLVTGGSGFIGRDIVKLLFKSGARVFFTSRNAQKGEEVAALITESEPEGSRSRLIPLELPDASNPQHYHDIIKSITKNGVGHLNGIVNCAGGNSSDATIGPDDHITSLNLDAVMDVMKANFLSRVTGTIYLLELLQKAKNPSVVTILSASSFLPLTRVMGYSAAMSAAQSATEWFATELQNNKKYPTTVRVNGLAPGFIPAEQNMSLLLTESGKEAFLSGESLQDNHLTDRGKDIITHTPMRRFGRPAEVANVAAFLLSDASSFITGQCYHVNGGFTSMTI